MKTADLSLASCHRQYRLYNDPLRYDESVFMLAHDVRNDALAAMRKASITLLCGGVLYAEITSIHANEEHIVQMLCKQYRDMPVIVSSPRGLYWSDGIHPQAHFATTSLFDFIEDITHYPVLENLEALPVGPVSVHD